MTQNQECVWLQEFYEKWIVKNGQSLLKYIYSMVRHRELAEDLYQEVLISAYVALHTIEDQEKFKSWIYKIAMNKCRDYWRKEQSSKRFWEEKVYLYEEQKSPIPEDIILEKCSKEVMVGKINDLPEIYREPLLLFYFKEKSLIEISSTKQVPLSTVKTRMRRAKDQLKPRVEELVAL